MGGIPVSLENAIDLSIVAQTSDARCTISSILCRQRLSKWQQHLSYLLMAHVSRLWCTASVRRLLFLLFLVDELFGDTLEEFF